MLLVLPQLEYFGILYHIRERLFIAAASINAVLDLVPDLFRNVLTGLVNVQGFGLYKIGAFAGLSVKSLQGRADLIRNARDRHLRHVGRDVANLGARVQQEAQAAGFGQLLGERYRVLFRQAVADILHCGCNSFTIPGGDIFEGFDLGIRQFEVFPLAAQFLCTAGVQIINTALRIA